MTALVSASILGADFLNLRNEISRLVEAGVDMLHIDVMDGVFVPEITFGECMVRAIKSSMPNIPLDVHLMITSPESKIASFSEAGADIITVHSEALVHCDRTVRKIKDLGKKAGVAIVPSTAQYVLEYVIDIVDIVLVMTVNPGFGGQEFLDSQLKKISSIKEMIMKNSSSAKIEVDGGINPIHAEKVIQAGADILVAGSFLFSTDNIQKAMKLLKLGGK